MPAATITPTAPGFASYTVQHSDRALIDLSLALTIASPKDFTIRFFSAAPVQVVLVGDPAPAGNPREMSLLPAPAPDETTFAGRRIAAVVNPISPTVSELACEISVSTGGAAGTDRWTLRISGLGGHDCVIGQAENASKATIHRVVCEPVAAFTIAGGAVVPEKTPVMLTASPATGAGTVVKQSGEADPIPVYRWTHDSDVAITDLPECGPQTFSPTMPGVYRPLTFNLQLAVDFDGSSSPSVVGFLHSSTQQPITVSPRPQRVLLVLDRSGSMFGQKWTNALTAGRILVQLFAALRAGTGVADQIGIVCFEDTTCGWHVGSSPGTSVALPLTPPAPASSGICSLDLGNPGSCTSIGDALVRAMDLFAGGIADDPKLTIVLLTDGMENAGPIVVGPPPPGGLPAGTQTFASARAARPEVNNRLSLYTVGVGSYTQEDVLNTLAAGTAYRHITDVDQLSGALAEMVTFSLEAREVVPDPPSGGTERTFELESKVNRLAAAVEWSSANDTLHLSRQLPNGTWQEEGTVAKCPLHGFVTVDLASLFGGADYVPPTTWRLTRESGGIPQPIDDSNVMLFVDLHATGDVVFDRPMYGTGEEMVITARLRIGSQGIGGATVRVDAAGPGESLGTLLASGAPNVAARIARPPGTTTDGTTTFHAGDPHAPKAQFLSAILRAKGLEELSVWVPPAIFVDGTNELHEDPEHPSGPGNYTNVFAQASREGSYTFRFTIDATLPGGEPYRQVLTLSKWVGVKADPFDSILSVEFLRAIGNTQRALITVTPKDRFGNHLGPFREDAITFQSTLGRLVQPDRGRAPLPGYSKVDNLDGSYSMVLESPKNRGAPIVTVSVGATPLAPTVVARGCLAALLRPIWWLVTWIVRLLRRG